MPQARFAVTLAPKNPDVKPIYDAWVAFAEELGLNVEFDAGAETPFPEMVAKADSLITTSIAEGFGLAFLEPWMADKPLTGRNLPEITEDFAEHGLDLSALYNRLPIPLSCDSWDIRNEFLTALEQEMKRSREAYDRPWDDSVFEAAQTALIQNECVDFGILTEDMQRTVIRAVKENPDGLPADLNSSDNSVSANRRVAQEAYNQQQYGDRLMEIYNKLLSTSPGTVTYADGDKLLDAFLDPSRFNLLRT